MTEGLATPRHDDEYGDRDRDRRDDQDDWVEPPRRKAGLGIGLILGIVAAIVLVCGGLVIGGGFFAVTKVREAGNRMKSNNNLKQIGLAIHNCDSTNGELPFNNYSPDGKPLLSWRVHILPYIEQDMLYRQFKLDEPWDGPNNIRLLNQMPAVYRAPNQPPGSKTYYRGFCSPGAVFDRKLVWDQPRRKEDELTVGGIGDGSSNTILVVEAGEPVEWTKPDDLDAGPGKPFPKMGGMGWGKGFQVLFADGAVRTLKLDTPEPTLRALVTHNGGEILPPDLDQ